MTYFGICTAFPRVFVAMYSSVSFVTAILSPYVTSAGFPSSGLFRTKSTQGDTFYFIIIKSFQQAETAPLTLTYCSQARDVTVFHSVVKCLSL